MASKVVTKVVFAAALFIGQTWADGKFLATPQINPEDLEKKLLQELAASHMQPTQAGAEAGANATSHVSALKEALAPMFAVVPKEEDGTLSHNVVRYVLQRFFMHQHGWLIRGLEAGNTTAEAVSSAAVSEAGNMTETASLQTMKEWAPVYLQSFLEKIMAGRGLNLRELAVLAATLEDLVHREEKNYLLQAYASNVLQTSETLAAKPAFDVLETYLMIYMLGGNWTSTYAEHLPGLHKIFNKKVSHWDETVEWLRNLLEENDGHKTHGGVDFDDALGVVEQVGNRFATFNTVECGRLKSDLLAKESAKPGRIRLVDFYKLGLDGPAASKDAWVFNEKIDFLRDNGILDESDPSTPLVILPNYMMARSNCLAPSSFYAVCCPNECEHLMQDLEASINTSTARPARIAKIVSSLSSATVEAPHTLAPALMRRLQDIASHHGGEIPLHGRLFALWMHHAFPRECPYPNTAGTASAQTADEWMLKTGQADSSLSKEEVEAEVASDSCRLLPKGVVCDHIDRTQVTDAVEDDGELPWDTSEELLVVHEPPREFQQSVNPMRSQAPMRPLQDLMFWCVLASVVYGFMWALKSTNAGKRLTVWAGMPLSTTASKYILHHA